MINPITLLIIGLVLVYLEFYVPGAILGTAGGLLLLSSVMLFAVNSDSALFSFLFFALTIGLTVAVIKYALWAIPRANPGNSIYLKGDQAGYLASTFDTSAIGKTGVVSADLKPGGYIEIDGIQQPANSESGYLEVGTEVVVVSGEGDTLIVRKKDETNGTGT